MFSQYDADGKGNYELLAKPNIDTGMGLERLAVVMQDVNNLFEVDTLSGSFAVNSPTSNKSGNARIQLHPKLG